MEMSNLSTRFFRPFISDMNFDILIDQSNHKGQICSLGGLAGSNAIHVRAREARDRARSVRTL